jgi:hypothetical protein
MAYQIRFINDRSIVKICHEGIVDVLEMNTCKNTAIIHLKRLGWNKVLIDITEAEFEVGTLDIADLFKGLENIFSNRAFIAVLQSTKLGFDYGQYSKSIAAEWSNTKLEVFNQENLALRWLTNGSDGA